LTDSPAGNYLPNENCAATLAHPIDLSGATDPVLTYWHKGRFATGSDGIHVQVSMDGGTTWSGDLRAYGSILYYGGSYPWYVSTWYKEQVDLQAYRGSNVVVRFLCTSGGDAAVDDGWYVDDVAIAENDLVRTPFPLSDNFENGLGNWLVSGHDWGMSNTVGRTLTHSMTDSPVGNYVPASNCAAILLHPIDLSATVYPVLEFFHKGFGASGDAFYVEVSSDGGSSWTVIGGWGNLQKPRWTPQPSYTPEEGLPERFDLRPWKSSAVSVRFRLASDLDGNEDDGWYIDDIRIREITDMTGVGDGGHEPLPTAFSLSQVHPNPFNPATTISFDLPQAARVRLEIFDAAGRRVRTLANEERAAGRYEVRWNGTDDRGSGAASGVYFCRMEAGSFRETRRMTLVK
jgi:hypothetical protein